MQYTTQDKLNILIIEDNPGDAHLVKIYLKDASLKHVLHHASTFYDGLEAIERQSIGLVLLDLSLPDMHGFKTLTTFLEKHPKMPVIVLTGLNDETVGQQAVKSGAQDYLVKGQFNSHLLGRVIRYALQRHSAQNKIEEYARNLAISEKRFLKAQEMAKLGNWEVDLVSNKMSWSEEVYRIFEIPQDSLPPSVTDYLKLVHIDDRAALENAIEAASKDGQMHHADYRIIVSGTAIKYISNHIKLIYDNITGKFILAGAVQDISEQKRYEKEILEKNLQDSNRKTREDILGSLGFHLRTPLNAIVGTSYLLAKSNPTTEQEEYIKNLKSSIDELSATINNVLNFSLFLSNDLKKEEKDFNLNEVLLHLRQIFQLKAATKQQLLQIDIAENIPEWLHGDSMKLIQALYNILDNALRYTHIGGRISLKVKFLPLKGKTVKIIFTVKDNGKGFSPHLLEEIKYSTDPLGVSYKEGEKRSLGIAIARRLMSLLDGNLEINSQPGQGATIELRAVFGVTSVLKHEKNAVEIKGKINILLVEDHFLNQMATKKVLTSWKDGVNVDLADNGQKSIELCAENQYDIVLMDLQMPIMDGFEAQSVLKETHPDLPIVALTANSSVSEMEKCIALGFSEYISKPFKPQLLFDTISSLLNSKL